MNDFATKLSSFQSAELIKSPTPIELLPRLSKQLGIELWMKRDDLTSIGFGGNKIRQLEYYFGAALAQKADTILITGAVQSNFVRSAATVANMLGMKAVLQLEERVQGMDQTYAQSGNVLLGGLLDVEYMHYPVGEDEAGADKALHARADALRAEGQRPYVIPLGLSETPLGALGYVHAAREILDQGPEFEAVVVPSGSGNTHGGLLTGLRGYGCDVPVFGVCVRRDANAQQSRLRALTRSLGGMLGDAGLVRDTDIITWDGALAPGYGQMGAATKSALKRMAQTEGIFLDPVYSAKTFAGLISMLEEGRIAKGDRVLFLHTGGQAALFAYQNYL